MLLNVSSEALAFNISKRNSRGAKGKLFVFSVARVVGYHPYGQNSRFTCRIRKTSGKTIIARLV